MPTLPSPSQIINCQDIVSCFQAIYNFLFAIFVAMAFLYFLFGAFEYLFSGSGIYAKEKGKSRMKNSIIALIIALVLPVILNMINPYIFKAELQIPQATVKPLVLEINAPETSSEEDTLGPGETVYNEKPNKKLLEELEDKEYITKIVVNCSEQKAKIYAKPEGKEIEVEVATVPIKTGKKVDGKNCDEENKAGKNTTPVGTFRLNNKRYKPEGGIISRETGANIGTRAITYEDKRGLLIHGSATKAKDEKFPNTLGCIRMKNADLAAIFDKVKEGQTELIINQYTWVTSTPDSFQDSTFNYSP